MTEWGITHNGPIDIMTDSSAVFHNIQNSKLTGSTWYWQADFWRVHAMFRARRIRPCLVASADQRADFLTKPVAEPIFKSNISGLFCDVADDDNGPRAAAAMIPGPSEFPAEMF